MKVTWIGSVAPLILYRGIRWGKLSPTSSNLRKGCPYIQRTEGWLASRTGLDDVENKIIFAPAQESNHDYAVFQPVAESVHILTRLQIKQYSSTNSKLI